MAFLYSLLGLLLLASSCGSFTVRHNFYSLARVHELASKTQSHAHPSNANFTHQEEVSLKTQLARNTTTGNNLLVHHRWFLPQDLAFLKQLTSPLVRGLVWQVTYDVITDAVGSIFKQVAPAIRLFNVARQLSTFLLPNLQTHLPCLRKRNGGRSAIVLPLALANYSPGARHVIRLGMVPVETEPLTPAQRVRRIAITGIAVCVCLAILKNSWVRYWEGQRIKSAHDQFTADMEKWIQTGEDPMVSRGKHQA